MPPLGNVAVGRRCRLLSRYDPGGIRQPLAHLGKNQPVVPPEALSTAHGLQKKQRQDEAFRKCAAARLEAYLATTIATPVWGNHGRVGGVVHMHLKMTDERRGGLQIDPILHHDRGRAQFPLDAALIEDFIRRDAKQVTEALRFRAGLHPNLGRYCVAHLCSICGGCCSRTPLSVPRGPLLPCAILTSGVQDAARPRTGLSPPERISKSRF